MNLSRYRISDDLFPLIPPMPAVDSNYRLAVYLFPSEEEFLEHISPSLHIKKVLPDGRIVIYRLEKK